MLEGKGCLLMLESLGAVDAVQLDAMCERENVTVGPLLARVLVVLQSISVVSAT